MTAKRAALLLPALGAQLTLSAQPAREHETADITPGHTNVYRSQFESPAKLDQWSQPKLTVASNGRRFLGTYGNQTSLYLTLRELPEHRFVRLRADLLMLMSLDGIWEMYGPDTWAVMVEGGPLLMFTTFCNHAEFIDLSKAPPENPAFLQHYPDEFASRTHPTATGESGEGKQLGFPFRPWTKTTDSIYKLDLIFPHCGDELVLNFFSHFTERLDDEAWGLDNVIVDVASEELPQSEEQLETLWRHIAGRNAVVANRALWQFVAAGSDGLAYVVGRWGALEEEKQAEFDRKTARLQKCFDRLYPDLEDEQFKVRQSASNEIGKLGVAASPIVEARLKHAPGPEERRALREIRGRLAKLGKVPVPVEDLTLRSRVDHIRRIFATHDNGYTISSSLENDRQYSWNCIGSPADGFVPATSSVDCAPRFSWFPNRGTAEWLEYEFPQPKTISEAEAYWHASANRTFDLPESWEILYRDEKGDWNPVQSDSEYPIARDEFNKVKFEPVLTDAVRLAVQLRNRSTAGVHEFKVTGGE